MKKHPKRSLLILIVSSLLIAATDPTRPPTYAPTAAPVSKQPMQLTAIYIYPTKRFAIIGGRIVKEGDQVNEFTISTITADTVELTGSQRNKETLTLVTPVKKPAQ